MSHRHDEAATRTGWIGTLLAICFVLAATGQAPAANDGRDALSRRLEAALRHRGFSRAKVGCLVVRADNGARLFARAPEQLLTPASNVKILTALGALSLFGPAHRFITRVYGSAPPDGAGVVRGLAVRGGGDPALTSEEWWRLAADLRRAGLSRIDGDILLDDSLFDGERWHPAWGGVSARAYHAPVSALSANYGAFSVEVRTGPSPGAPALVNVDPPVGYLRLRNEARTGARGSAATVAVERRQATDGEEVIVSGSLPLGSDPVLIQRSVADPLAYAGAVLGMQLDALGIAVTGRIRAAAVPDGFTELLAFAGKPLAEIARLFMKYSNNHIAETLLKALGAERGGRGSWEAGSAALRAELVSLGLSAGGFHLVDGSGLAKEDRVSAETLVAALRIGRGSFRFGPELVSSLPIASRDGTLQRRASASRDAVRAKTGLLAGAVGLSGFAQVPEAGEVAFSLIANDYASGDAEAMAAADAFAAALVGSGSSAARP